ncbi:MAG: hypothetical protein IKF16_02660 [Lachnospiraceae bacterium]|nr:hypothetical protein [Lachnospiraceae bacterium]
MTYQPTLESLIHRMELRHQHIEDELPEKERLGAGAYYRHELRMYERFLAELHAIQDEQPKEPSRNTLCDLYVIDKTTNRIHRIGEDTHDSLVVYPDGGVRYYNMQNGDGGGSENIPRSGYCILATMHGQFSEEYGIIDDRFEEHIKKYMEEQDGKI